MIAWDFKWEIRSAKYATFTKFISEDLMKLAFQLELENHGPGNKMQYAHFPILPLTHIIIYLSLGLKISSEAIEHLP